MPSRYSLPEPATGQRWRLKDSGLSWRITLIKDDVITLTGPGPCRSAKTMSKEEFLTEWMPV